MQAASSVSIRSMPISSTSRIMLSTLTNGTMFSLRAAEACIGPVPSAVGVIPEDLAACA
jgi:hypothetical protein